jgi:DNA-binding NarL/FixJ family response regulator
MAPRAAGGDSQGMASHLPPVTVFLADDSALIRARLSTMLESAAVHVVGEGTTAQACIHGILATHPDVVVLDVQLEQGTGLEVLRAVRLAEPDISFVVFSHNSQEAYRKRYLEAGANRFLDKSSEFELLAPAVAALSRAAHH